MFYSCLSLLKNVLRIWAKTVKDREAWQATVHGVSKSWNYLATEQQQCSWGRCSRLEFSQPVQDCGKPSRVLCNSLEGLQCQLHSNPGVGEGEFQHKLCQVLPPYSSFMPLFLGKPLSGQAQGPQMQNRDRNLSLRFQMNESTWNSSPHHKGKFTTIL